MEPKEISRVFSANADVLQMGVNGLASAAFNLKGTLSLTVQFEATIDGKNWFALKVTPVAGGSQVSSATAAGDWTATVAGYSAVRMRVSAYTSGTPTAFIRAIASGGSSGGTSSGGGDASAANQETQTTHLENIETAVEADKEVTVPMEALADFTITLASLANNAARQSTLISNSGNKPAALVSLKITSGGVAPTAGSVYEVYLLRKNTSFGDDAAGDSDAAITIENAQLLGTIVVTATTAKAFYGIFDTAPLGPLGPTWGIAVKNVSGQALSTTEADHLKKYQYYNPLVV